MFKLLLQSLVQPQVKPLIIFLVFIKRILLFLKRPSLMTKLLVQTCVCFTDASNNLPRGSAKQPIYKSCLIKKNVFYYVMQEKSSKKV